MDKSCYDLSNLLLKEEPVPFDNLGLADCFAESGNYFGLIDKQGFLGGEDRRSGRTAASKTGEVEGLLWRLGQFDRQCTKAAHRWATPRSMR